MPLTRNLINNIDSHIANITIYSGNKDFLDILVEKIGQKTSKWRS